MIEFPRRWVLFDYVDSRGVNVIKEWLLTLEKTERAKLNRKLEMLERNGPDLATGLLAGTKLRHIDKIRVKGRVASRLMVCRGPINPQEEFTLLFGAKERDRKLVPPDAEQRAENHRIEVENNPRERRTLHERVS